MGRAVCDMTDSWGKWDWVCSWIDSDPVDVVCTSHGYDWKNGLKFYHFTFHYKHSIVLRQSILLPSALPFRMRQTVLRQKWLTRCHFDC